MLFRLAASASVASLLLLAGCNLLFPPQGERFDGCGTMIQGTECVLFQADEDQKVYLLADREAFVAGDRVHVTGRIDPDCVTICMEGDGCIRNNTIDPCDE